MIRTLLLADHRQRDTAPLTAIQYYLEKRPDFDVQVVSFDLHQQALELFQPHVVVVNHLHGNRNQGIADKVRRRGGLCVVLPTEGRPNTWDQVRWATQEFPPELCDLYLSWSDEFSKHLPAQIARTVTGGPKFDFYFFPLCGLLTSREELRGRVGLLPEDNVCTIAPAAPQAKFAIQGGAFHIADWKDLKVTTIPGREDPHQTALDEYAVLSKMQEWLKVLSVAWKGKIVVSPHPAESVNLWEKFCYENNIMLVLGWPIWDVLAISDIHLPRSNCLTICDAWFMNKPTIFLRLGRDKEGPAQDAQDWSDFIHSPSQFFNLFLERQNYMSDGRQRYLKKWLSPGYGACERIADAIAKLIEDNKPVVEFTPTLEMLCQLSKAINDHDKHVSENPIDFAGQYQKSVRQRDIEEWQIKLRSVL